MYTHFWCSLIMEPVVQPDNGASKQPQRSRPWNHGPICGQSFPLWALQWRGQRRWLPAKSPATLPRQRCSRTFRRQAPSFPPNRWPPTNTPPTPPVYRLVLLLESQTQVMLYIMWFWTRPGKWLRLGWTIYNHILLALARHCHQVKKHNELGKL